MIRVYLDEYYSDDQLSLHSRKKLINKYDILKKWLANLHNNSWEWGIIKVDPQRYRCLYFANANDATAFCLTFNITHIVHER